ncbi:MAG: hypothetical protein ACXIUL_07880 [Wenzhouxiangella sp.]
MSALSTSRTLLRALGFTGAFLQIIVLFTLGAVVFVAGANPLSYSWILALWLFNVCHFWGERWQALLASRRARLLPAMRRQAFPTMLALVTLQVGLVAGVPALLLDELTEVALTALLLASSVALGSVALGLSGPRYRLIPSGLFLGFALLILFRPEWLSDVAFPLPPLLLALLASLAWLYHQTRKKLHGEACKEPDSLVLMQGLGPGIDRRAMVLLVAALLAPSWLLLTGLLDPSRAQTLALIVWAAPVSLLSPLLWRHWALLRRSQWRRLSLLPGWSNERVGQHLNQALLGWAVAVVLGQWILLLAVYPTGLVELARLGLALLVSPAIVWLAVQAMLRIALVNDESLAGFLNLALLMGLGALALSAGSVIFLGIGHYPLGGLAGIALVSLAGALLLQAGQRQAWRQAEF